ncbi:MAG: thioesterase family protein, partial [Betaproteobacteria bacterium]
MTWWRVEKVVRFAHCDPAGIVFYPRFFELIQEATEDFFRFACEMPFERYVNEDGFVMPAVALDVRWHAPSRLADMLAIEVGVARLGTSSLDFAYEVSCRGERRMSARTTQVQTRRDTGRPAPIVEPLRGRLARHFVASAGRAFE